MSLTFPPIPLESLRPETRDWLLAQAAAEHKDPLEILQDTLDRRAEANGFSPEPASSTPQPKEAA